MNTFVDTSAILALLDDSEQNHAQARQFWQQVPQQKVTLVTTNYVIVETISLIQRRAGMVFVRRFQEQFASVLNMIWVDAHLHQTGLEMMLVANRRKLSLVDCVSFATMRQLSINTFFAFDQHFVEQGFVSV